VATYTPSVLYNGWLVAWLPFN